MLTRGLRHLCHISILRDSGSRTQDLGFRIQDSEDSSESIRGLRVYIKGDLTLVCLLDSCLCILNSQYTLSFTLIPITTCAPILTSHQQLFYTRFDIEIGAVPNLSGVADTHLENSSFPCC